MSNIKKENSSGGSSNSTGTNEGKSGNTSTPNSANTNPVTPNNTKPVTPINTKPVNNTNNPNPVTPTNNSTSTNPVTPTNNSTSTKPVTPNKNPNRSNINNAVERGNIKYLGYTLKKLRKEIEELKKCIKKQTLNANRKNNSVNKGSTNGKIKPQTEIIKQSGKIKHKQQ